MPIILRRASPQLYKGNEQWKIKVNVIIADLYYWVFLVEYPQKKNVKNVRRKVKMQLKKFCEWLVKESVNLEINKKLQNGEEGILFLRWVHSFLKHLAPCQKKTLKKYIPNIEANIESMYEKIVWQDIKKAIKEMKINGNENTS